MNIFVDLTSIKNNIKKIREITNKNIIAVIKSNAYGLGAKKIIKTLLEENVNYFFFNKMSEYLKVQDILKKSNVIIHESMSINNIEKYYQPNMILTINSNIDYERYKKTNIKLRAHIQVDTGMNRLGIKDIDEFRSIINDNSNIDIEGVYTHFTSNIDEYDYYEFQKENFEKFLKEKSFKIIHSAASLSLHKSIIGNMVRVGMGLYGYHTKLQLEHAVKATTKLINIVPLKKNEFVGYSKSYQTKKDELIGVVDIGYFDNKIINKIYYLGKPYPFVGKSCMNHSFIILDNKINLLSRLSLFQKNDIMSYDNYYELLVLMDHIPKNYITRY